MPTNFFKKVKKIYSDFASGLPSDEENKKNKPDIAGRWTGTSSNDTHHRRENGPNEFELDFTLELIEQEKHSGSIYGYRIKGSGTITSTDMEVNEPKEVFITGYYSVNNRIKFIQYYNNAIQMLGFVGTSMLSAQNEVCVTGKSIGRLSNENVMVISEIKLTKDEQQ